MALVPAWAMMLYSISEQRSAIESDVIKQSLLAAELAARQEEQFIEGAREVLTALQIAFQSSRVTPSDCHIILKQVAEAFPRYSDLGVVNPGGDVLCSAVPHHAALNVGNAPWFKTARHSKRFSVGDEPAGSLSEKPVLVISDPFLGPDGQVRAVCFAAIDLDWLDDFHVPQPVSSVAGSFLALVDQNGMVLSMKPDPRQQGARLRDGKLLHAIAQGGPKVVLVEDPYGGHTLYAISPVRSQWPSRTVNVVFAMPKEQAFAEADRTRNRNLALLALVSVLVVGTFWLLGNSVFLRRLEALVTATRRLADGDLKARSGLTHQSDELGHLAKTFDGMAQALERREREHQEAEAKIRSSEDQLRRLQAHVQQVREEDRLRLAREIHDHLGQALTALKIDLSWLRRRGGSIEPAMIQGRLDGMSVIIDDAMETVHHLASELRPRILDDLGLAEAIEWQTEEFQKRTGIPCDTAVSDEDLALSPEQSTALFRIFQEALTNIARHSGATQVTVSLDVTPESVSLLIADNGRGIRTEEIENPLSYGLLGIRERAYSLGGEVEIKGEAGSGTGLKVSIPLRSSDSKQD
ncbi:MAG: histidine kinase [Syntrophobacteraceae bacterium]